MKSYYILTIPFIHLEKNDNSKIPFSLREEKTRENLFKNYLLNIFILLELLQKTNKSNKFDNIFNIFSQEEKNLLNNYEIGKIYDKKNIGNEYGFCFIGNNFEDFKFNVQTIKKSLFILSHFYFYFGEIISKTFKNINDIKIVNKIPLMSLQIKKLIEEKNYLEIKDIRNNNKIIMNCFNDNNTQKVFNYLSLMKNITNDYTKNEFNTFINNIEKNIFK